MGQSSRSSLQRRLAATIPTVHVPVAMHPQGGDSIGSEVQSPGEVPPVTWAAFQQEQPNTVGTRELRIAIGRKMRHIAFRNTGGSLPKTRHRI